MAPAPDIASRVAAVHRAVQVLADGDDGVRAVAAAMDAWITHGGDFAEALGLRPGWQCALRLRGQDAALGELGRRYFPGLGGRALARALVTAARDYEIRRWPRDRIAGRRPDGADGFVCDALRLGPLPGEETLRKRIG